MIEARHPHRNDTGGRHRKRPSCSFVSRKLRPKPDRGELGVMRSLKEVMSRALVALAILVAGLGCSGENGEGPGNRTPLAAENLLYVVSNSIEPEQNAILGFRRADDGSFVALTNGTFPTRGTGGAASNANQQLIASPDRKLLFAVNTGSDSIAVFQIDTDGNLRHASGSPFESSGPSPVSLGLAPGGHLFVAHQDNNPASPLAFFPPGYGVFTVSDAGLLAIVPGAGVGVDDRASPTQALVSPDGRFFFGAEELNPLLPRPRGALRSFRITSNGELEEAPGSPTSVPYGGTIEPRVVGLAAHPKEPLIYASYWRRDEIAVFRYTSESAQLIFVASVPNSGSGGIKSMVFNQDGSRLYAANAVGGSITVYDTSFPREPVEIQNVPAKAPRAARGLMIDRELRAIALDPTGKLLYVLDNWSEIAPGTLLDNSVHTFEVADDGKVTEAAYSDTPLLLPGSRAIGLVVF